jgi:chromosome segregation protein
LRLAVQGLEQELTRVAGSRERLGAELAEVDAQARGFEQQIDSFNEEFERLDSELAERQQRVEELRAALEGLETAREQAREALRQSEREAAQADFTVRATLAEIERLDSAARTAQLQREAAASERQQIDQRLAQITDVEARQALQGALEAKTVAESGLSASRNRLDELSQQLRLLEEQKLSAEREQEPLRLKLTDLQLQEQAARLGAEQFAAQLAEVGIDEAQEAALREAYGGNTPKPSWLQGEVTRLANAIAALGPVNLAALDELTQSRERQQFLQAQNADLNEAISTLEDAIRKIDRETRELLRETFDSVNAHFGSLFPRLFGGGEAKLILTGDEILDAGVQVMAQPPGKRTTSIHLLSGGEKALTAIALVFAMFQLNPAPFCLLDEVDAPLDDSNTERYAEMVREMAEQTQFLFITHNKIAMEFAEQLIGVTMQERGVSRIVAVDLEAASRMAEAA